MSRLRVYDLDDPADPVLDTDEAETIAPALETLGVRFERWPLRALPAEADADSILAAYAPEVERLKAEAGYRSVDIVRMTIDHPDRASLRTKFLSEHRHHEDEVRFFVEGEGLFTLRTETQVFAMLCSAGDLISVPAGMRHWFDMGPTPRFTAIRLFENPDGWVAHFTGDAVADRFPKHEAA